MTEAEIKRMWDSLSVRELLHWTLDPRPEVAKAAIEALERRKNR